MMNNSLDEIVKCNIEISNPASAVDISENILIVVPQPTSGTASTLTSVGKITSAADLLDYGFAATDDAYEAVTIALGQASAPSFVYVLVRTKNEEGTYEDITTALKRADAEVNYYGIHLSTFKTAVDIKAAADYAEANEKLFGFEYTDYATFPLTVSEYARTYAIYSGEADGYDADSQPASNAYAALAIMALCFTYDSGSETWAMKTLSQIVPSFISSEEKEALAEKNIGTYLRYADTNVTQGGKTLAGEWIDVIRFRDWLKKKMQIEVFGVLKANRKVPFNDSGIGLIEGAMLKVLKEGQNVGGISEDEYDSDGNVTVAYTVTVPKAADLTEAEKKSRKLANCKYSARLAGAIHLVEIKGYLSF